nr:facilitated trehalose transporter Tret1-like [Danaus plexippus plexippus]
MFKMFKHSKCSMLRCNVSRCSDDVRLYEDTFQNYGSMSESKPFIQTSPPPLITKTPIPVKKVKPGKEGRGKAFKQIVAAFVANLGTINTGMAFGFSATALPQLKSETSSLHVTENEASWIASLSSAGTPIGCILSGYLMDAIGRRRTLIVSEVPLIIGWILVASAVNVPMMYVGRLLIGLGSGMVGAPARVYTCEVSQPHLRGMLGALASVGVSTGVLIQVAFQIRIRAVFAVYIDRWTDLSPPLSDCPRGIFLNRTFSFVNPGLGLLGRCPRLSFQQSSVFPAPSVFPASTVFPASARLSGHLKTSKEIIKALLSPSALKPFGILALYFFIYQWCGVNTITFYAVEVFEASGASLDKYYLTISMGVLRVVFTVVGCILCRRCGRRPLTFVSAFGCGSTMIILSVYMYYVQYWNNNNIPPQHSWIPIAAIYLFTVFCTLGYLIVPWIMIGEVYPTQVRGIIGGMTTCAAHLSIFTVVKTFPYLKHALNDYGTFGLYGAMSIAGENFLYQYHIYIQILK